MAPKTARTTSTTISAYAASAPKGKLVPFSYEAPALRPKDVLIKVSHCGVCHSDVHLLDGDWGPVTHPFVPGHEVIGTVQELGSSVTNLKRGDRVGVGWQKSACLECAACMGAIETACPAKEETCVGHHGGFSSHLVADSRFAFRIPDALESESAAPLLCGGITVFSPLMDHADPTMKVGVIGIGGLGHFALQFARAYGCEVVAFSTSQGKEKEAKALGAHRFVLSIDKKAMQAHAGTFGLIIATSPAPLDTALLMSLLAPRGKICVVGAMAKPIEVHAFSLIGGNKGIVGNSTGSRAGISKMLDFAARHGVRARSEVMPIAKANEAVKRVREGKARYRVVLKA